MLIFGVQPLDVLNVLWIDILSQDLNLDILFEILALRFFLLLYVEKFRMTKLFFYINNPYFLNIEIPPLPNTLRWSPNLRQI